MLLCERLHWGFDMYVNKYTLVVLNRSQAFCVGVNKPTLQGTNNPFLTFLFVFNSMSLLNVKHLRFWLLTWNSATLDRGLCLPNSCCMIYKKKIFFLKGLEMTFLILEFCPQQVTTVKLCIIMRNIYYCIWFSCNIWLSRF